MGETTGPQRPDAFPTTLRTWLGRQIDQGETGRARAFRHVMSVYAAPLKVYFRGSSMRWLGDADDIVQGFFADRLSREEFLDRWRESERPLRYWLIVGFKHYLMEESRRLRRDRAGQELPEQIEHDRELPERDYDRECALSLVREAIARAEEQCVSAGQGDHWRILVRHHLNGEAYNDIARDEGLDARRCAVMARTAAKKLKTAMRDQAGWDDADQMAIDREINDLREALER